MKRILSFSLLSLALLSCSDHHHKTVENPFNNAKNNARFADNEADLNGAEDRLDNLEDRVSALEAQVALSISQIDLNSSNIVLLQSALSNEVTSLQAEISALNTDLATTQSDITQLELAFGVNSQEVLNAQADIIVLQSQLSDTQTLLNSAIAQGGAAYSSIINSINSLSNSNSAIQNSVNTLVTQMAQIQLQDSVVGLVDPCPAVSSNTYKEFLFKMKSGKLVAYFEDGGKRFLTVVTAGNYRTTDARACNFTVTTNNTITN